MELTLLAVSSVFLAGVGYAFVQRAQQSPFVVWTLVCASLFALSTRDLFRSRERDRLQSASNDGTPGRPIAADRPNAADRGDASDDRPRPPVVARLLRRIGGWFG